MSSTISSLLCTVVGFGIQLVLKLWKDVMNWFGNLVIALANLFTNTAKGVEHAAAIFLHKPAQGVVGVMHKLYYKDEIGQHIEKMIKQDYRVNDKIDEFFGSLVENAVKKTVP